MVEKEDCVTKVAFLLLVIPTFISYNYFIYYKLKSSNHNLLAKVVIFLCLYTIFYFIMFKFTYDLVQKKVIFVISVIAYFWLFYSAFLFVTMLFLPVKVSMILSSLLFLYGFYEADNVYVRKIKIDTPLVKNKVNIVFFSDLHISVTTRKAFIEKFVRLINSYKPDIVISGGDLVDFYGDRRDDLVEILKGLEGEKLAVMGNHEYYVGSGVSKYVHEKIGFRLLPGNCVVKDSGLEICGIDEILPFNEGLYKDKDGHYRIIVRHRPKLTDINVKFDLFLAGHTHRGQILPFRLLTYLYYRGKDYGLFKVNGYTTYVSGGVGTWGLPIRVLSPPEIVVIEIN